DLGFLSFSWILIFLAFVLADHVSWRSDGRWVLLNLTLLVTVIHRHLTFPLVYGDKEVFNTRPKTFTWLPVFFIALTALSLLYVRTPSFTTSPLAQPVSFSQQDRMMVHVRKPQESKNFRIKFSGAEKSVAEVAQRIQEKVEGYLQVELQGDRLKFSPAPGSDVERFSFGAFRGEGMRDRMGIPKASSLGWQQDRPFFIFLLILASLWNFYHTLMQKMGILRIYSRKGEEGRSWLDKSMVWVWFGWLFFALAASPVARAQAARLAKSGRFIRNTLEPFFDFLPWVAHAFLIVGIALTLWYFWEEWKFRERIHWPKNLFLLSLWGIYLTFFYDFFVGFLVFAFSHAVEYLAFVNVFAKKKYATRPARSSPMARWVRHQWQYFALFTAVSCVIFIPWYFEDRVSLNWYIVGTSFLHFLYDGWIWKVRKPEVGTPLGISYGPKKSLAPSQAA
ncbi:MAG: hypothetical protein R3257_06835, partial [bacterium]|nr:hypothetical protein [bacterium]